MHPQPPNCKIKMVKVVNFMSCECHLPKQKALCIKSGDSIFRPAQVFLAGKVEAHFWGPWLSGGHGCDPQDPRRSWGKEEARHPRAARADAQVVQAASFCAEGQGALAAAELGPWSRFQLQRACHSRSRLMPRQVGSKRQDRHLLLLFLGARQVLLEAPGKAIGHNGSCDPLSQTWLTG